MKDSEFQTYVRDMLDKIDIKIDDLKENTIRHDEKIKHNEKNIKMLIKAGFTLFAALVGSVLTYIFK
jgi:hypothetical protein